jgi:hypothetical protein
MGVVSGDRALKGGSIQLAVFLKPSRVAGKRGRELKIKVE